MPFIRTRSSGVLILAAAIVSTPFFVLLTVSVTAAAASPIVVESRDASSVTYQPPIEERAGEIGIEQQYQLQLLQREVMQLRGQVETLQYELQQMKRIQEDRYLELDSRLQQALSVASSLPTESEPVQEATEENPHADVQEMSEKELYDTTQLLIRNRQYDLAITQLEALIARFPEGAYTPNAYYWLGQVYAVKANPDFEKARQALAQVIQFFPEHNKVPDAAYALGKTYYALGDCERARDLLQQVVDQHKGKSAAKLAENYLRESVNCDA